MNIACIGWGSLIWDPRRLIISGEWNLDGPSLPIEFSRLSKDKRVTLIIDWSANPVQTLWVKMALSDIDEAIENLRRREHTTTENIFVVKSTEATNDPVKKIIKQWLTTKNLDAAIWTGLSYSEATNYMRPLIGDVLAHLKTLSAEELENAKKYICQAPSQIDTDFRTAIYAQFGWSDQK